MIENFEQVRSQLKELAEALNAYKSEAVQLRLVELIFGGAAVRKDPLLDMPPAGPARKAKRRKTKTVAATLADGLVKVAPAKRSSGSSRRGAAATITALVAEGFFKSPQTIGSLVTHCDTKLASKFKQSEFSGTLARLVREKVLTRAKNGDNQYEYIKP